MIKKFLTLSILLIIFSIQNINAQDCDSLNKIIDEEINVFRLKRISLAKELKKILNRGLKTKIETKTKLRSAPNDKSKVLTKISKNSIIKLHTFSGFYRKVTYHGKTGYVWNIFIKEPDSVKIINNLKNKIKELKKEEEYKVANKEKIIKKISLKIQREKVQKEIVKVESKPAWVKVFTANVRETPSINSKIVDKIVQGKKVFIQKKEMNWYFVKIKKKRTLNLTTLKELENYYSSGWIHENVLSNTYVSKLSGDQRRRIKYVKNHPNISNKFKSAILNGEIILGMTDEIVIASWGYPDDKNRTVGSWGIHEQWIYSNGVKSITYLYFENGILKSWQD